MNMTNELDLLESILGQRIERRNQREIPGLTARDGIEVVYFSVNAKSNARKLFRAITNHTNPPSAQSGGVSERGCVITTPCGIKFNALSYHGDLDGWRTDIEKGATACGVLLAKIEAQVLVLADERVFPLNQCTVEFL